MLDTIRHIMAYVAIMLAVLRFFIGDVLRYDTGILTVFIAFVILLSIDYRHFRFKHYLIAAIGIVLSVLNPNLLPIILLVLICVVAKDLCVHKVAIICFIMQLIFLYYMYYKISVGEIVVHKVNYEKALTYDFGFGNSNTFAMFMYSAILCAYIAFWKRLNICFLFLIFLVSYIVFLYAFGRTVFVSELIFICSIVIAELGGRKILHKIKYWLALFPLFALVSFLFIIFNFQEYELLNELLTGRIILWTEYIATYMELNVWIGADVVSIVDKPLDNSYITLLVYLGIIGYALYAYLLFRGISKGFEYLNKCKYVPFVISILICGMIENILVSYYPANIIFMLMMYKGAYCMETKQMHIA